MITLYDCATAPSPRRARILLAEKGITHETVQVDLRSGEQLGAAYRKLNPQCTVLALRTDEGLLLTDNAAITAYLEARFPQPPLLGTTPEEKAEIASWNWRIEFEGLLAIAEALRNSAPAMANRALPGPVDYPQIPELAQRGLARVRQHFADLDARLAGRAFIATDRFSVADITAVVVVDFARVVKIRPDEQHSHLQRWRAAPGRPAPPSSVALVRCAAARMLDQCLEERALRGDRQQELGMPLHAEQEAVARIFNGLHDAVEVASGHTKVRPGAIDALIVQTVDAPRPVPDDAGQHRAGLHMQGLERHHRPPVRGLSAPRPQLLKKAAAAIHVQQLGTATDPQHGDPPLQRCCDHLHLEGVARRVVAGFHLGLGGTGDDRAIPCAAGRQAIRSTSIQSFQALCNPHPG